MWVRNYQTKNFGKESFRTKTKTINESGPFWKGGNQGSHYHETIGLVDYRQTVTPGRKTEKYPEISWTQSTPSRDYSKFYR